MVGITFRHSHPSSAVSGSHYMVGWLSTGGAQSHIGLYRWAGGQYTKVKSTDKSFAQ
jgi:hypothetical protein